MVVQKFRNKPVPRPQPKDTDVITRPLSEDTDVIICGKKFPKGTVKNWDDIKKEKALGSGHFGQVYKGFLHLNDYTR